MISSFEISNFSESQRILMFYSLYIPYRYYRVHVANSYHKNTHFKIFTMISVLFGILSNIKSLRDKSKVWWNREIYMVFSISVITSIITGNSNILSIIFALYATSEIFINNKELFLLNFDGISLESIKMMLSMFI